ncbi:peptide deformylase [bacterium]|nr:peptide deformylase [bacterium]
MEMTVLTDPQPTLRHRSVEVAASDFGSERIKKLADDLIETMNVENGCGIAAPQVGVNERVIIVDPGDDATAYVNPVIVDRSFKTTMSEEGCLSVPGVWGMVKRNRNVTVRAFDLDGNPVEKTVDGLHAIIFQHEIDHLDGILFIDRVEKFTRPPKPPAL